VTPSVFRFRRTLDGTLPAADLKDREPVQVEWEELPGVFRARTEYLEVTIQKRGLLVRVRHLDGSAYLTDLSEARPTPNGFAWEREAARDSRYYGFGPRADAAFDLRGKTVEGVSPFLYSTAGYGEYHVGPGSHRFDFSLRGRYRIEAPAIDYYFYYGPSLKQVMEDHHAVRGTPALWPVAKDAEGSWTSLRAALLCVVQGAISARISPILDLGPYANGASELQQRARQLGSLVAEFSPGRLGTSDFRKQLESFFDTYLLEAHEKGYPVWHPLPWQFPFDPESALHADEFMLGDEMLIAPIVEPGGKRAVYLPQGSWTNLETDEVLAGRRIIPVATASLPVFARNGVIVPLDAEGEMALHYFGKLPAEFFLADATQIHAAPAGDILRLEIESKKERSYEWVAHHVDRPALVGFEDRRYREVTGALEDGTWRYHAAKRRLEIRIKVAQGEDAIVNVAFE
jgi:hypothetical protein